MRLFRSQLNDRYCILFFPQNLHHSTAATYRNACGKTLTNANATPRIPRSAIAIVRKNPNVPVSRHKHAVDATTYPHHSPSKKEKKANFPLFQSSCQNSLSGEMLLYANCSKIHIFNIRQRSPVLYFNRFARKTPTKNTGRNRHPSFFTHAPHTLFFSLCVFLLIQKIFICQKCRNCFGIL